MIEHDPITDFSGDYRYLSNFYDGIIDLKGRMFASAEHAFQACKTRDPVWQKDIQQARSPAQARRIGRECPIREDWEKVKVNIMRAIIEAKFPEVSPLSDKLSTTGNAELIEGNTWNDKFWGAVWITGDPDKPEGFWAGTNMLGKLLMERRKELRHRIPY